MLLLRSSSTTAPEKYREAAKETITLSLQFVVHDMFTHVSGEIAKIQTAPEILVFER
jgi:hypothetical protein